MSDSLSPKFNKVVFISYGMPILEQNPDFPDIDKIILSGNLKQLAYFSQRDQIKLVLRDHPAVTPMMEILYEAKPDNLVVVPEEADISEIIAAHRPAAAFFLAGTDDVMKDFRALENSAILQIPLFGTGGAAETAKRFQEDENKLHPAVRNNPQDLFGHEIIKDVFTALTL